MPGVHGVDCGCKDAAALVGSSFLLPFIRKEAVKGLNERVAGSAKNVIRSYENRLDDTLSCRSISGDPELIIHVPFTSPCKVTGFHLIGGDHDTSPTNVKLFINRTDLDFSNIHETKETQVVDLVEDFHGSVEYPLKAYKFQNVSELTLFFPESLGADSTQIHYLGLRGVGTNYQRKAVVTVYEARPNLSDHNVKSDSISPNVQL